MFRYLAFTWNDADPAQCATASTLMRGVERAAGEWFAVLNLPRLSVYCSGASSRSSRAHVLANRRGVVLGELFDKNARPATLDAQASERIHITHGRCLVDDYWGSYVGFLYDDAAGDARVLRDPTGGLKCFVTSLQGARIAFSHAEDCLQLGLRFSVDLDYVAAYLVARGAPESVATGLREVTTVLAGECLQVERERVVRGFTWNPFEIAARDVIVDPAVAIEKVRSTVRACVRARASRYESIVHKLSGGLDSSIVLACLQDAPSPTRITCLTHYAAGADRDERSFARFAARRAGCALIEMQASVTTRLESLLQMPRSVCPSPNGRLHQLLIGRDVDAAARAHGAQAVFSGEYGDMIFYRQPALAAAIDYVWLHGLRPTLFRVALDVARLAGASIWHVLYRAVRDGLVRTTRAGVDVADQEEAQSQLGELLEPLWRDRGSEHRRHPWFESAHLVPPGKRGHVSRAAFNTFLPDDSLAIEHQLEQVMPLYSQPILEVALRIALPLLVKGGWDRSIARRAFACDLPPQILTRRTKGGTEQFVREVLFRNIEFVRETLLEGVLAEARMLKLSEIAGALAGRHSGTRVTTSDLYWLLGTEAWLRSWHSAREGAQQRACAVFA